MRRAPSAHRLLRLAALAGLGVAVGVAAAATEDLDRRDITQGIVVIIAPGLLAAICALPRPRLELYATNSLVLIPVASVTFGVGSIGTLDLSPGATVIGGTIIAGALSTLGALVIGTVGVTVETARRRRSQSTD